MIDGAATASKYVQPDANYFANVKLPPYLLKAEYRDGLGKSRVTANGLELSQPVNPSS